MDEVRPTSLEFCSCGRSVRLGAFKITAARRRGVAHYIQHTDGTAFTSECVPSKDAGGGVGHDYVCAMMKPYPTKDTDKAWCKMMQNWNAAALRAIEEEKQK